MQESEFTGCANKVQGNAQNHAKIPAHRSAALSSEQPKKCFAAHCQSADYGRVFRKPERNHSSRVDAFGCFLYDELSKGA